MKKEIFEALKAKFMGVSDNILDRIAAKLAKTVTTHEQVASAVEGVTVQQVIESYGDSRATEAAQTAVSNYESKHGLKDGKSVQKAVSEIDSDENNNGGEKIPAWAQAIIESNKTLSEQMRTMQGEKLTASRREQLSKIISTLTPSIRKAYERTPVDTLSDEEFETLKGEISSEAAEIARETTAKGVVFGKHDDMLMTRTIGLHICYNEMCRPTRSDSHRCAPSRMKGSNNLTTL